MSEGGSDRRTVFALCIALGAALLLIAFLLGRESAGTAAREAVSAEDWRPDGVDPDQVERSTEEKSSRRWPAWADLTDENHSEVRASDSTRAVAERIEVEPTDSFALTHDRNRPQPQTRPNAPGDARSDQRGASVAAYFQQVDLIHSEEGAGDPNVFAMDLIKGGLGGATSGFDQLIADTKQMEREMQSLTPPSSCESYHEASLEALVESREMLERMKEAIVGRDIEQLNAVALQSKTLQSKAQAMKEMRKQILTAGDAY
ncbi:MAG: hypothetical protein WBB42_15285 [Polyangiales bacterium]